jgi:cytoskeletal protein RodZ
MAQSFWSRRRDNYDNLGGYVRATETVSKPTAMLMGFLGVFAVLALLFSVFWGARWAYGRLSGNTVGTVKTTKPTTKTTKTTSTTTTNDKKDTTPTPATTPTTTPSTSATVTTITNTGPGNDTSLPTSLPNTGPTSLFE